MRGVVKKYFGNKGYGFLARDGERDVFFHISAVKDEDARTLAEGHEVEFEVGEGKKGLEAFNIQRVKWQSGPGVAAPK